jgi:hypothetical protein
VVDCRELSLEAFFQIHDGLPREVPGDEGSARRVQLPLPRLSLASRRSSTAAALRENTILLRGAPVAVGLSFRSG